MSKELTNKKEFTPTPHMQLWLDTAIEIMSENISDIASKCKVSRQSWYQWNKNSEFLSWFRKEWRKRLRSYGWKLDVIGINKAKTNHSYWKSMQERIGNLPINEAIEQEEIKVSFQWYEPNNNVKKRDS